MTKKKFNRLSYSELAHFYRTNEGQRYLNFLVREGQKKLLKRKEDTLEQYKMLINNNHSNRLRIEAQIMSLEVSIGELKEKLNNG